MSAEAATNTTPLAASPNAMNTFGDQGEEAYHQAAAHQHQQQQQQLERPNVIASRFRTKLCRNYVTQGSCPYEHRCMFAHGEHQLRTKEENVRDRLTSEEAVKHWQRGARVAASGASALATGRFDSHAAAVPHYHHEQQQQQPSSVQAPPPRRAITKRTNDPYSAAGFGPEAALPYDAAAGYYPYSSNAPAASSSAALQSSTYCPCPDCAAAYGAVVLPPSCDCPECNAALEQQQLGCQCADCMTAYAQQQQQQQQHYVPSAPSYPQEQLPPPAYEHAAAAAVSSSTASSSLSSSRRSSYGDSIDTAGNYAAGCKATTLMNSPTALRPAGAMTRYYKYQQQQQQEQQQRQDYSTSYDGAMAP